MNTVRRTGGELCKRWKQLEDSGAIRWRLQPLAIDRWAATDRRTICLQSLVGVARADGRVQKAANLGFFSAKIGKLSFKTETLAGRHRCRPGVRAGRTGTTLMQLASYWGTTRRRRRPWMTPLDLNVLAAEMGPQPRCWPRFNPGKYNIRL